MIVKVEIRERFNQGASTYDTVASVQKKVAVTLAKKLPNIEPHRVMEIGCGTGIFTTQLVNKFSQAHFFLIDLAPKMVESCKQRYPKLNVVCDDVETMTIPDEFDLIASSMTFHWLQDLSHTLTKLREKLTAKGALIFSLMGKNSFLEWKNVCQYLNMPHGFLDFPCITQLQKKYPHAVFTTETFVEQYRNARDFLGTLKKLGADTSHANYVTQRVGQLRSLIKHFDRVYSHGAPITYEIIYGWMPK